MKNDIIIKKSGFVLREKGMGNSRGGLTRISLLIEDILGNLILLIDPGIVVKKEAMRGTLK